MGSPRILGPMLAMWSIACSAMVFQVTLIHGARATLFTDTQFIILPLTLLGLSLGGIMAHFRSNSDRSIALYAILIPFPYILLHFAYYESVFVTTAFLIAACSVFAAAGWYIASLLKLHSSAMSKLIGADLAGAALGAVISVLLLTNAGYISAVCISIAIAFALFSYTSGRWTMAFCAAAFLLASMLPSAYIRPLVGVTCPRIENPVAYASNSIAEIAADERPLASVHEMGRASQGDSTAYLLMMNCVSGATIVLNAKEGDQRFLQEDFRSIPLVWWEETHTELESVLVPSAGGGIDVMRSLLFNPTSIDATEFNPIVIELSKQLSDPSTYPYDNPRVHLFQGDTSRFLGQTDQSYDLILNYLSSRFGSLASIVDTPNYSAANEMTARLFARLSPTGAMAIVGPPGNSVFLGMLNALKAQGMNPSDHIIYIRGTDREDLSLSKKSPFTDAETVTLKRIAQERGYTAASYGEPGFPTIQSGGGISYDRPYAYYNPNDIEFFRPETFVRHAFYALTICLAITGLLCALALRKRIMRTLSMTILVFASALVAASIGFGFITFEFWAIQKLFLAIADPTISFATVLAALLLFGGAGSASLFIIPHRLHGATIATITVVLVLFCYFAYPSDTLLHSISMKSLAERIMWVFAYLSLPSFALGMYLPALLTRMNAHPSLIPLIWGIDGLFAVVGGFGAKAVFHMYGLHAAFPVIALCYVLAGICFIGMSIFPILREKSQ